MGPIDIYMSFVGIAWMICIFFSVMYTNLIGLPTIDKKYDVQSLRDNDGMEAYYDKRYEERKRAAWEKRHGRT